MWIEENGRTRLAGVVRLMGMVVMGTVACAPVTEEPLRKPALTEFDAGASESSDLEMSSEAIVGGQNASEDEYPFAVYASGCGGTLISSRWVMTAAHCAGNFGTGSWVNIGGRSLNAMFSGNSGEWRQVEGRSCHPSYSSWGDDYDYCLVRLSSASTKQPLPIDTSNNSHAGDTAVIVGWGNTSQFGGSSNTLKEATVNVFSQNTCTSLYGNNITSRMVCAGYLQGGIDTCQGDSGGPLIGTTSGTLIGVTSWGYGCAQPNSPGVYARVATVADWVCNITNDEALGCVAPPEPTDPSQGAGSGTPSDDASTCNVARPEWVGDGYCDGEDYNTEGCAYDGGDCCEATCQDADYTCGVNGYQCADPLGATATCEAPRPEWIGDGYCDRSADYNNPECGYDGGDCCRSTCTPGDYSCGYNGYQCLDPSAP